MNIYVYITNECEDDVREHSINKEVNQFKNRLIQTQRTTFFDNFPPPYLKKRFKRQLRLLAAERRIENEIIIVFYRILVRGGKDYEKFLNSPKEYGDLNFAPLAIDSFLKKWLATQKIEAPIPEKKQLTEEENLFLYGLVGDENSFAGDFFIYETYDWIKHIQNHEITNRLILIPELLIKIIDKKLNKGILEFDTFELYYKLFKEQKALVLLGIIKKGSDSSFLNRYNELFKIEDIETINRVSGKSYPSTILIDADSWINIQRNNDSNIALSPEETELLKSVQIHGDEKGFPLFINGRAGSGKSTILQYLFADYLRLYYNNNPKELHPPIYLTYSNSLVEKCRSIVFGLIKYGYKGLDANKNVSMDNLKMSIREFKSFLLERVPVDRRAKCFSQDKYVDYSKFKKLWHEHYSNDPNAIKDYGPDISWHIIRSYIKGISIDGYLEKDEYRELPKEEKNITVEKFGVVYEKVWRSWYLPLCTIDDRGGNNYWDDQDLVRFLLEHELVEPKYPAVFCDEAQDFTRLELELLLRLNIFTECKIDANILKKIPFAFAGDPFQTLNPTGFRWESIKSTYVEKFIHSLSPELRYGNPELNFQELSFNYRSSESIVKFCNNIQLLRMVLFDYQNLKPQKTWQIEDKNPALPVFFNILDTKILDKIREQTDLCIIVPCLEGEEKEFVENDEYLNSIVVKDDTGVPLNVFSPMRAKGLEFTRVLLYRFADMKPHDLDFAQVQIEDIKLFEKDNKIPLEYFINQLYVAASRGQKRLYVVDSVTSFNSFWKFTNDSSFQDELMLGFKNNEEWEGQLGDLVTGTMQSWGEERENLNEIAKQREEEGKLKRDPYFLRQAAMYYKSLKDEMKEADCLAYALQVEGKFNKAGELYLKCKNYENSIDSFWKGKHYKELHKISKIQEASYLSSKFEIRISSIISEQSTFASQESFLIDFVQYLKESDKNLISNYDTNSLWQDALIVLLKYTIEKKIVQDVARWEKYYQLLKNIINFFDLPSNLLAVVSFEAKEYFDSIKYFESIGDISSTKYKDAKVFVLIEKIKNNGNGLSSDDYDIIAEYYYKNSQFEDALKYYGINLNFERVLEIINSGKLTSAKINEAIKKYILCLSGSEHWQGLIQLFDDNFFGKRSIKDIFLEKEKEFLHIAVKEIALSASILNAENRLKEKISDFLRQKFIYIPFSNWEKICSPELVGCALEKAGRDIDCLKYYERVANNQKFDADTQRRAIIRWVFVKNKQAEREDASGITEVAKKHREEALAKKREFSIDTIENEPKFPDIQNFLEKPGTVEKIISSPIEKKQDVIISNKEILNKSEYSASKITVGEFILNYNRNNKRINIEDTEHSYQLAVLINEKKCQSADLDFEVSENKIVNAEIGINFLFNKRKKSSVILEFIKHGISLEFKS